MVFSLASKEHLLVSTTASMRLARCRYLDTVEGEARPEVVGLLVVHFSTMIWIFGESVGDEFGRTGDILVLCLPSPLFVGLGDREVMRSEVPKQSFLGLGEPEGVTGRGASSLSQLM